MVSHKREIFQFLRENRGSISSFGVTTLGLFGSFAQGRETDKSDIDLLVEFQPDQKSFDNFIGLAYYLEDQLGRKVDLVTRDSLSPYLGPHILREVEYLAP